MNKPCLGFKLLGSAALALLFLVVSPDAKAAPVAYNFDGFADGTAITNQIAGLTFVNSTVLRAGGGLNDTEFPPRSGAGVVLDASGAITINFATPVFSVGGYFTYLNGLTFSAYNSLNALLGSDTADFASNTALSGSLGSIPNELLSLSDASGQISRVVITGEPLGSSFTLDDLTVDAGAVVTAIPEPQTLALVLGALGLGWVPGSWLRRRSGSKARA